MHEYSRKIATVAPVVDTTRAAVAVVFSEWLALKYSRIKQRHPATSTGTSWMNGDVGQHSRCREEEHFESSRSPGGTRERGRTQRGRNTPERPTRGSGARITWRIPSTMATGGRKEKSSPELTRLAWILGAGSERR